MRPEEPAPDLTPEPEERFVHGLLAAANESEDVRDARLARLSRALDEEARPERTEPAHPERPLRREGRPRASAPRRRMANPGVLVSAAASLALLVGAMFFATGSSPALALVREAIEQTRTSGARRYALTVDLHGTDGERAMHGTFDVSGDGRVLAKLTAFEHVHAVLGRDGDEAWLAHPGAGHMVLPPEKGWMRWLRLDRTAVLIESVDAMLAELESGYDLTRTGDETWSGELGKKPVTNECARIDATRRGADDTLPALVQLWIEPKTSALLRMDMSWPELPSDTAAIEQEVHDLHGTDRFIDAPGDHEHDEQARPPMEILEHGPRFGERAHLAPERIRFDLRSYPELTDAWFRPETHSKRSRR